MKSTNFLITNNNGVTGEIFLDDNVEYDKIIGVSRHENKILIKINNDECFVDGFIKRNCSICNDTVFVSPRSFFPVRSNSGCKHCCSSHWNKTNPLFFKNTKLSSYQMKCLKHNYAGK